MQASFQITSGISRVAASLALLSASACIFMGPVSNNGASKPLNVSPCQITVQNDTFASKCTQIQVRNTGSLTMVGWRLTVDLPADGHLQSTYNGNFAVQDSTLVITPYAKDAVLSSGQTVLLNYCASSTGSSVVAQPGICNNTNPTPGEVEAAVAASQDTPVSTRSLAVSSSETAGVTSFSSILGGTQLQDGQRFGVQMSTEVAVGAALSVRADGVVTMTVSDHSGAKTSIIPLELDPTSPHLVAWEDAAGGWRCLIDGKPVWFWATSVTAAQASPVAVSL